MRRGVISSGILACAVTLGAAEPAMKLVPPDRLPEAPEGQTWRLRWHDEFDGDKLDERKWEAPEHAVRDGWWTQKAVGLDGKGHLVLRTYQKGDRYYDGGVRTRGKFEHTFGLYVARMQFQRRAGHWSAFWLWNRGLKYAEPEGGPLRFEVDIVERPFLDDRVEHAVHWGPLGKDARSKGEVPRVPGVGEGWHTFAVLWTPDEYVFFVDGKETWRPRDVIVCQYPLYILLTDEIEFKGWAGDIRKATLPDEFLTDYVRVYDLVDATTGQAVWKPKPLDGQ